MSTERVWCGGSTLLGGGGGYCTSDGDLKLDFLIIPPNQHFIIKCDFQNFTQSMQTPKYISVIVMILYHFSFIPFPK